MASKNQLVLELQIKEGNFFSTLDRAAAKSIETEKRINAAAGDTGFKLAREAEKSTNARIKEEQKYAREVDRINTATRRDAERNSKLLENASKKLADARIAQSKRTQDALIADLARGSRIAAQSSAQTNKGMSGELGSLIGAGAIVGTATASFKTALDAGLETATANRVLASSAKEAGLAYDDLSARSKAFSASALLSEAAGARVTAQLVQFVNAAGKPEKLDQFTKSLTDLAAARGLKPAQIQDIARQLNTLEDEATDRLLGANPSAFYEPYAKSIGKVASNLTDAEKRASVLDATIRKGAIFSGDAAKKTDDLAGKLEQFNARVSNVAAKAGTTFANVGNNAFDIAGVLGRTVTNGTTFVGQLDADLKAKAALRGKELAEQIGATFQENLTLNKRVAAALADPNASVENLAIQIAAQNPKFKPTPTLTGDISKQLSDNTAILSQAKKDAETYVDGLAKSLKGGLQSTNITELRLAQQEFYLKQGLLDNDTRRQLAEGYEKAIGDIVKSSLNSARELGKTSADLLTTLTVSASNNPFVKVYSDAETAIARVKEATKDLSKTTRDEFVKLQQVANFKDLFSARLDSALGAFDLREQAKAFRNGAPEQRDSRLMKESDYLRIAQGLPDAKRFLNDGNQFNSDADRAGFITKFLRGQFEDPNKKLQDKLNAQLEIINREVRTSGSSSEALAIADRRALAIAGNARPEDLSSAQREQLANTSEREAVRFESAEKEANKLRIDQTAAQKSLAADMKEILALAKSGNFKVRDASENANKEQVIKVVDAKGNTIGTNVTGRQFTPESAPDARGNYSGPNGFSNR